jgi:hypothetical protein
MVRCKRLERLLPRLEFWRKGPNAALASPPVAMCRDLFDFPIFRPSVVRKRNVVVSGTRMLQISTAPPAFRAPRTRSQTVTRCLSTPPNDQGCYRHWRTVPTAHIPTVHPKPGGGLTHLLKCRRRDVDLACHTASLPRVDRLRKPRDLAVEQHLMALHLAHGPRRGCPICPGGTWLTWRRFHMVNTTTAVHPSALTKLTAKVDHCLCGRGTVSHDPYAPRGVGNRLRTSLSVATRTIYGGYEPRRRTLKIENWASVISGKYMAALIRMKRGTRRVRA